MSRRKRIDLPAWLIQRWNDLRSSYWFIPSLMALGAVVAALVVVFADEKLGGDWLQDVPWLYANQPSGARALLSTIAGSMITVAGVTFSITIAAVSFTSGQFGPRILTNFMSDRGNQITLGTFIATFLYCLLVLRTVRDASEASGPQAENLGEYGAAFVPHLGILLALVSALASIGVLIFFIHHIPRSIHIANVVARIGRDILRKLDQLFPEHLADGTRDAATQPPHLPNDFEMRAQAVSAAQAGYIQHVDNDRLLAYAAEHNVVLRLLRRPGDFVSPTLPLLLVYPAAPLNDAFPTHLQEMFAIGDARTPHQDILFLVDELVEIAARALSPGINDPFTANNCISWLGASLLALADRRLPSSYRYGDDGTLRVTAPTLTYATFLDRSLQRLRPYAAANATSALHTFQTLADMGTALHRAHATPPLLDLAHTYFAACQTQLHSTDDLDALRARYEHALRALRGDEPFAPRPVLRPSAHGQGHARR